MGDFAAFIFLAFPLERMGGAPKKPSPWGEGGWPPGQTDEGAVTEYVRFSRGDFAAPAASDFLSDEKVTKESPGKRPMDYGSACAPPRSIGPLSPDPHFTGAANYAAWFVNAKARVAQSTHRTSSFATADLAMVESLELPFLRAPLLRRGSSCAAGDRRAADSRPYGISGSTFVFL